MSFIETVNAARQRGLTDEQILEAIKKQNPQKKEAVEIEQSTGKTATQILNEMISQTNTSQGSQPSTNSSSFKKDEEITLSAKDLPKSIPSKPSQEIKLWMRIFITLSLSAVAALSFTVLYRAFFIPTLEPIKPQIRTVEVFTPSAVHPLVKMYPEKDDVKRVAVESNEEYRMHLRRLVREEDSGVLIRLIIEDISSGVGREARISNLEDFFKVFDIAFPETFFDTVSRDFDLYIHTEGPTNRIALITQFPPDQRQHVEMMLLRRWEETIEKDFQSFFNFWGVEVPETTEDLLNKSYRGEMPQDVSIRYREGTRGAGLYYTLKNGHFIFATSADAIKKIVDRNYKL